ncbi:helix-turn-helix transcriptional regulator [Actinomadura kijaniata]
MAVVSDNELGTFLRLRRESVTPAEVGLPTGPRRRTPGLRRAELATLAGISVEYLTRLEQGRDRNPSLQVLAAIADALRLSHEERMHLLFATKHAGGKTSLLTCPAAVPPTLRPRATVLALLERLEPTPAVVVNRLNDLIAYTSGYERLVRPLGILDGERPNLVRYVFANPRSREVFPDWEWVATQQAAVLKDDAVRIDEHAAALAQELTLVAGKVFTERVAAAAAFAARSGTQRIAHPEGELRLAFESLALPDTDGQELVVYLPDDEATARALDRITGRRPGTLRMVTA